MIDRPRGWDGRDEPALDPDDIPPAPAGMEPRAPSLEGPTASTQSPADTALLIQAAQDAARWQVGLAVAGGPRLQPSDFLAVSDAITRGTLTAMRTNRAEAACQFLCYAPAHDTFYVQGAYRDRLAASPQYLLTAAVHELVHAVFDRQRWQLPALEEEAFAYVVNFVYHARAVQPPGAAALAEFVEADRPEFMRTTVRIVLDHRLVASKHPTIGRADLAAIAARLRATPMYRDRPRGPYRHDGW